MQPKSYSLQDLALVDPIAAYGILRGNPRVPISMNARATFTSAAVPQQPIESGLDTTITTRTWIDQITYTVRQPNVFAGNIFKPQYDVALKQATGVEVQLMVLAGPRYVESVAYTPLENLAQSFTQRWAAGWPLKKLQTVQASFNLVQAPPFTNPNAAPYNVILTLNAWQFLEQWIDDVSLDEALTQLAKAGLCTAKPIC